MSTAQIKSTHIRPFLLSCALHVGCVALLVSSNETTNNKQSSIAVKLHDAKNAVIFKRALQAKPAANAKRSGRITRAQKTNEALWGRDQTTAQANGQMSSPLDASSKAKKARPKHIQEPEFTARALTRGIEGEVILQIKVDETGRVIQAVVQKSLGYGLDETSLDAIRMSTFEPALDANGIPTPEELTYHFKFEIKES